MFLGGDHFILVSLLVEVGFMASLASLLITTRFYQRLLRQATFRRSDPYVFGLSFGLCLAIAVGLRFLIGYSGMDVSLPGALLAGLFAGPVAGGIVGFLVGGAGLTHGEWLALPFGLLYGLVGGAISKLPETRQRLWDYSPFPLVHVLKGLGARSHGDLIPFGISAVCMGLDVARYFVSKKFGPELLWSFQPESAFVLALTWVASLVTLGVPLRIWNNTRLEMMLKSQESHAIRARLDALTHQINPHFLFNTLTSITAATRRDPELARDLIQRLSQILRRVLSHHNNFVSLKEELEYIDSYLNIEVARFGHEKLRIRKVVDDRVLETRVPCMVLQPLVENAVNHAIAPLHEGGTVSICAWFDEDVVHVEIADDGAGFDVRRIDLERTVAAEDSRRGIGLANVHQRLKMAYGQGLEIESRRGEGTHVTFHVPSAQVRDGVLEAREVG